ncbi:MAG TPA: MFS transporter [Blastocatellia bacterium]|nr:MFS transporter [Blastocatellia bacterium]
MSQRKALWTIYACVAVSYLGVGLVAPLISIVLNHHGAGSFVVGLVGTTMFGALAVSSFPIGTAVDRFGPKIILVLGLIVYSVAILLFAFIDVVWLFFAVRAVEGIAAAAISVATETMINQLSDPLQRGRRMSYYGLSVGIGWALGPLAGGLLFGIRPWLPFVGCFGFSIVSAILVASLVPHTGSGNHKLKGLFTGLSLAIAVPLSAGALHGYLMSSLVTLFPLYLNRLGFHEVEMGSIVTAVILGMLLSQLPIGRAGDRFGKRWVLFGSSVALGLVFALMPGRADGSVYAALGALVGAFAGSLYPLGLATLGSVVSHGRLGAATALFSLAFGIGSLTGPTLSGLAMKHLGDRWLFYLPSILCTAFAIELAILYRRTVANNAPA